MLIHHQSDGALMMYDARTVLARKKSLDPFRFIIEIGCLFSL